MSRFHGHVGNRTQGAHDGLTADACGWHVGGRVYVYKNDEESPKGPRGGYRKPREVDKVSIYLTDGSAGIRSLSSCVINADSDGAVSMYANGKCVWENTLARKKRKAYER